MDPIWSQREGKEEEAWTPYGIRLKGRKRRHGPYMESEGSGMDPHMEPEGRERRGGMDPIWSEGREGRGGMGPIWSQREGKEDEV